MRNNIVLGSVFLVFLASCATKPPAPPPPAVISITGKSCTTEIKLADAISLVPKKKSAITNVSTIVDSSKPCVNIDGQESNYIVYSIPEPADNSTFTIGGRMEATRIFAPIISILDQNGKETRRISDDKISNYGELFGAQFRTNIGDKYVLVRSNPKLVGQKSEIFATRINVSTGYAATPVGGYSYQTQSGHEGLTTRLFSHEGNVDVILQAIKGKIGLPEEK